MSQNELLRRLRDAGCAVERTHGGHFRVRTPAGQPVIVAATPSDHRAWLNTRARLRRAGVQV